MRVLICSLLMMWAATGLGQEQSQDRGAIYYIVSTEEGRLSEHQATVLHVADNQAPIPIDALRQTVIPLRIPGGDANDWEMDLPLLLPDDSVLHLIGRATIAHIPHTRFKELHAQLSAASDANCTARIAALMQTQQLLAQKITLHCLGRSLRIGSAQLAPVPQEGA